MFPERLTEGYRAFLDGRFSDERSRYAMLRPLILQLSAA